MKPMMTIALALTFTLSARAATDVQVGTESTVTYHCDGADGLALGEAVALQRADHDTKQLNSRGAFALGVQVNAVNARGLKVHEYTADVTLGTQHAQTDAQGRWVWSLHAGAAQALYDGLSGLNSIEQGGVIQTFVKTLTLDKLTIRCGYTSRGFIPYDCTPTGEKGN